MLVGEFGDDATLDDARQVAEQVARESGYPMIVLRPALHGDVIAETFNPKNDPNANQQLSVNETLDLLELSVGKTGFIVSPDTPLAVRTKAITVAALLTSEVGGSA
jgi:hypothetical protein